MAKETIIIMGAIAAGVAVAGSLFLLYADMMFKNTSFDTQGGATTDVPVFVDATTTASAGSNGTNSTPENTTAGAPATTAQPY
jgi:hypothetical protein